MSLIGRKAEIQVLEQALNSPKAEMIALVGRRRVGKTFLVNTVYEDHIVFKQTGVRNASAEEQLRTFRNNLQLLTGKNIPQPQDWLDAFFQLRVHLQDVVNQDKKVVLFFDELSWLAVPESGFLNYLGHFWNDWASQQQIVIVICGSVSSWIIQKVINDKGGLHNRVTQYIHLKPFTLAEVQLFLQSRNIRFTPYQITQLYMAIGGIPLYLEFIEKGKSVAQVIEKTCFSATGFLTDEFSRLYAALFDSPQYHVEVIRALATKWKGLSRNEIIKQAKIPNGGAASQVLEELILSDFITSYHPFGKKKKDKLYRLTDEYSLFFLHFIEPNRGNRNWLQISQSQSYKIWCGYAFESICMKHIPQIKKALGVSGVHTTTFSFLKKGTEAEKGLQIDMLMERADQIIHLFEMKFHNTEYRLEKDYATRIEERQRLFLQYAKTKKLVFNTLITPFGLTENDYSSIIDQVLKLEDLFEG